MTNRKRRDDRQRGFTLIELLVVVTIIGILAGIAVIQTRHARQKALETALRADLYEMRKAIDNFYADKQRYPTDLKELVPRYLRNIPKDPFTKQEDWEEIQDNPADPNAPPDTSGSADAATSQAGPGVIDVKSRATGTTLDDHVAYKDL
ncbi:MAG: ral secretion pathway protein [Acidobacteriota bacterium]|jgi:general secretion pathway protein G|nr:ral secretion pathway protein [Acidobacteriota bacterium]